MFKIAYCAGHYLHTPGKRVPKKLDINETREWILNDKVADFFAEAATQYQDVQLLRTDDPTGMTDLSIKKRTAKANEWGADIYLDMHHNAAGRVFSGGGVVAFSYPGSQEGKEYRDAIYNAIISAGGIKGDRSEPLQEKKFDTLKYTHMTAVLMEYGFMDSTVDYPIIMTDSYAKLVAYATMEGIAKVKGLKKIEAQSNKPVEPIKNTKEVCTVELKVLRYGDNSSQVRALQTLLEGYGYKMKNGKKTYKVDGKFGTATENAVKAYQKAHGLVDDGIVGAKTWAKLLGI